MRAQDLADYWIAEQIAKGEAEAQDEDSILATMREAEERAYYEEDL